MTMSSVKKKKSLADQINEALKPKELVEETDDNEARFEEFTEQSHADNQLSDIRKQTAKSLSELDSKYKGNVVSRAELEDEYLNDSEQSDNGDELEEENFYATDSDDEAEDENLDDVDEEEQSGDEKEEESGEERDEESNDSESDDDLDDDDYDLSQFTRPQPDKTSDSPSTAEHKNKLLKNSSLDEEIKKGISVQSQLKVWEKLLEVRIKSQKMLITANCLPDFDNHLELSTMEDSTFSEKVGTTCERLHGLLDNLLEIQSTLCNRFPESKDVLKNGKRKKEQNGSSETFLKRTKLAEFSDRIEDNHNAYSSYRNQVLQKWHERTKSVKDSKNPAASQNIMTKIENSLLGKSELMRKTQIYRGDYEIYGVEKPEPNDDGTPTDVQLPEIFDDSDFYHQLLRELIEYKSNIDDNQSEITKKFIELQKVRSKMKKKVDTRASKGRKIRYVVHNKLVNYMPPKTVSEYTEEAKTELYNSLFGMANQGEKL